MIEVMFFSVTHTIVPNFISGAKYVVFQFFINTFVLLRLFIKSREKNNDFWICLGIVLVNYIMFLIFMYIYLNIGSCNSF